MDFNPSRWATVLVMAVMLFVIACASPFIVLIVGVIVGLFTGIL